MSRSTVNLALLGLGEHEQRVLVSAVSALAGPAVLSADVHWSSADEADVVIVAIDRPEAMQTLAELDKQRPREPVRYASHPREDADVVRPLRIQHLLRALQRAIEQIQQRSRPTPGPTEPVGRRQFYRGAEVTATAIGNAAEVTASTVTEGAVATKRMYRGRAY